MISQESIELLKYSILVGEYTMILPVNWDHLNRTVKFQTGLRYYISKLCGVSCIIISTITLCVILRNLIDLVNHPSLFIFGLMSASALVVIDIVYLALIFQIQDGVRLLNSLLQFSNLVGKCQKSVFYY